MEREEFKRQLNELMHVIGDGIAYFHAWQGLAAEDDDTAQALNRYHGLFVPARTALVHSALLQFAKVYDRHSKALSLVNILKTAHKDMRLVPHITDREIEEVEKMISKNEEILIRLKSNRDQRLAHHDSIVSGDTHVLYGEMKKLEDDTVSIYNILSTGFNRSLTSFDRIKADSERNALQVVQLMRDDLLKAKQIIKNLEDAGL